MTIKIENKIAPGHEPIAGYVLEELIGRGGYGEVWRASAPGGMKKAIKFVYGHMGEKRTEQELKSLERIKGVQHPFILGLERFESVDNQLVVVTELADGSLEDLLRQHRDRGSCGIPRDTLLSYLRDVADGLDYLHQLYQLQHLDIKPANLLMVGGRVKVADFGLLKDLRDIECSVVGGLTPIYAPPEVFDGKPSIHSDQYSMAVMYQELLTGTRPFTGRTIAQLATQHVHNAPNLSPLPPSDRPVVARALEKAFDRRFGSCSEFVESLARPRGKAIPPKGSLGQLDACDTESVGDSFVAGVGQANVEDLPQLNADQQAIKATANRSSLVVAIGGTGAQCVTELMERVGTTASEIAPVFHTVFVDTDELNARSLRRYDRPDTKSTLHSLATPLRTANEYRDSGLSNLRSMSRRWIYNVPRSGCTEGMRPLGRLALIDHWAKVRQSLQTAIEDIKNSDSSEVPGIYVVGSIAGGTASGMYLDLVHVLRNMLDEAGLEQTTILSLLATSELEADAARPLALHDTLASLQEIQHFSRPGNSYPGDAFANLPSLPAARSPLGDVYLVATSPSSSSPKPYQTISDYLWFDTTLGNELLRSARSSGDLPADQSVELGTLRSVGILSLSHHESLAEAVLAPAATNTLLARWLGDPADAKSNAEKLVEKLQERSGINRDSLFESVIDSYGHDTAARQSRLIKFLRQLPSHDLSDPSVLSQSLKAELATQIPIQIAGSDIQPVINAITRELKNLFRVAKLDVISAIETIRLLIRALRQCQVRLTEQSRQAPLNRSASPELPHDVAPDDVAMLQVAWHIGEVLLDAHAMKVAACRADALCHQLTGIEKQLTNAATLLAQAIRSNGSADSADTNPWDTFGSPIARQVAPFLVDLHANMAKPWLVNLVHTTDHIKSPAALVAIINQAAIPLVKHHLELENEQSLSRTMDGLSETGELTNSVSMSTLGLSQQVSQGKTVSATSQQVSPSREQYSIGDSLRDVRPSLLTCGGQQRLILVAGEQKEVDVFRPLIEELHEGKLTCVIIPSSPPMLIHEAQHISIDDVVSRLTTLTGGNSQVSDRLLTRCDIDWSCRKEAAK
ncbi:MAG: tubulin-like doman-containing protein [Pirellulaceae bacterium]